MKSPPPQPPQDAPLGTIWFGGPISWFKVSFSVSAKDLDPVPLTSLFGIEPDFAHGRGVELLHEDGSVKRVTKFGIWSISIKPNNTDEWDIEEVAWGLLLRLPEDVKIWHGLPNNLDIRLSFALTLQSFNQGFSIEPKLAKYVAERNITMDFDIYREDAENT